MGVMKQASNMEKSLLERLTEHGFKKKRANVFVRKENECIQHISILVTKTKGEESAHIRPTVGFTYETVNKLIYALQGNEYDRNRFTAHISMEILINRKEPYDFYINKESDVSNITDMLVNDIKKFAFNLWESCNSIEKYYRLLRERNELIRISTYSLRRPEWNLLALSILLKNGDYEAILNEYQVDFIKYGYSISDVGEKTKELIKARG
ncbi:MAG: hypothetical protein FWE14_13080 [Lachnospiraceae bacterium]|nr:hypothetical protein [Lachnospiraceae bacterium]